MKICSRCNKHLEKIDFYKDSKSKDGLFSYCKKCSWEVAQSWRERNKGKVIEFRKNYYQRNKVELQRKRKVREVCNSEKTKKMRSEWNRAHRIRKYGITIKEYNEMLKSQDFRCAICETEIDQKTLNIDHCHITNKVRGILCTKCNVGLGHLEKTFISNDLLDKALAYLGNTEKWEIESPR